MAKQGGQSEIGSVSVGVTADTTNLTAGLQDAKAQTEQAASSMGNSWISLGKTLRTFRTQVFGVVSAISGMVAAIGLVVGAIGGVIAVVVKANTRMDESRRLAKQLDDQIRELFAQKSSGLSATLEELDKKLQAVDKTVRESPLSSDQKRRRIDIALDAYRAQRQRAIESEVAEQRVDAEDKADKRKAEANAKRAEEVSRIERESKEELERADKEARDAAFDLAMFQMETRLEAEQKITEEKKKQQAIEEDILRLQSDARREAQRAGELNGVPAHVSRIRSLLELSSQQRFPPSPGNGSY